MAIVLKDPSLLCSDGLIAGAWRGAVSSRRFSVTDPASGEAIAQVANMGAQEARDAVDAAAAALPAWRARSTKERVAVLRAWHGLILAHADDLAMLMTREQGKPLAEAKGEVLYAASFVEWFAEEARRAYGEIIPSPSVDRELFVFREAIGVAAAITPWNFPAAMITRKCAPALAVGCTVVVKPAEATPLTALALAELGQRAGFPAGIFNVVVGDADAAPAIGGVLCEDPRV
ncbi:MAG TPA: aldehyde dehydrogenase family protein, partial [Burkholderiaceae bacterium]|nr:aldehyde dehydrogenase family protein [Burkholderiaceae bacterium]